jgi:hypothetical protein
MEGEGRTILLPITKILATRAPVGAKGGDAITFDLQAAFGNGGLFRLDRPERKRKPRPLATTC